MHVKSFLKLTSFIKLTVVFRSYLFSCFFFFFASKLGAKAKLSRKQSEIAPMALAGFSYS